LERYHRGDSFWGLNQEPLAIIEKLDPEKPSFRPSKWPRKLKTAKNSKLPKLPENCFERVGKGGWPPISTWIDNERKNAMLVIDGNSEDDRQTGKQKTSSER
jgi:hypothetical protein